MADFALKYSFFLLNKDDFFLIYGMEQLYHHYFETFQLFQANVQAKIVKISKLMSKKAVPSVKP